MAPNVSDSFNPITGFLPVPGVTDNPTFEKANKQLDKEVPGLSGINAVGDFASRLTEKNTWLRAGEVAIGVIILYVALKAMFPSTVGAAGQAGKDVAVGAALA